jgi:crossover junction endodeoxyribonuclease RuvC
VHGEDLLELLSETRNGRHVLRAFVERQQPMPGNGSSSNVTIGAGIGSLLAVLQVTQAPYELVMPATWKRALGLDQDKCRSLDKARALFPQAPLDRARDNGRAEAMLLAEWGRRRLVGGPATPERDFSTWNTEGSR